MTKRKKTGVWLITVALAVVSLTVTLAVKYYPHTLPSERCGEVYRRYAQRDDLKVGFVKDYRINDTITVDVTTITAPDSASWEALLREMNVNEVTIAIQRETMKSAATYYSAKGHPEERVSIKKVPEFDLVVLSVKELTIYSFDVESIEKSRIIQMHKYSEYI